MTISRSAIVAVMLAFAAPARAQGASDVVVRDYVLPAWRIAAESTAVARYSTPAEYSAAAQDDGFILEKVEYTSQALRVVAYVYRPRRVPERAIPVVIFNRGGYVRRDIAPELLPMFHRLALAGFAVVAPMYRGSDGGQGRDEMGGADLADLANVVTVIRHYPSLDARNVFLYGESRGGMMVLQAVRDGFPARAAATFGAFTDLARLTGSKAGESMARAIWPDFAARRDEIVDRRSALRWAGRLTLPLLVMHGSLDREVPASHALELAVAVSGAVRELGVVVFPGGSHTLNEVRTERDRLAVDFFRRHLDKPGT